MTLIKYSANECTGHKHPRRRCPKCHLLCHQAMTEGMFEDYWYCWVCKIEFGQGWVVAHI